MATTSAFRGENTIGEASIDPLLKVKIMYYVMRFSLQASLITYNMRIKNKQDVGNNIVTNKQEK